MSIRQHDIAQQLGLSVSTVSLALRDDPQISEATRHQVRHTATKLGYSYRPRQASRVDIQQIAFITIFELSDQFYSGVLKGAVEACQRHEIALQYSPLKKQTLDDPLLEKLTPQMLKQLSESDALLLVGAIDKEVVMRLAGLGRPLVLVDNNVMSTGLDRVLIENTASLYHTVMQLAQSGHERIAFFRGPEITSSSFRDRWWGYHAAMTELGLEPIEMICGEASIVSAEQTMADWLDIHKQPSFTAIIGCNDQVAIGAMHALQHHGLRVPTDVAIIGFDDIDVAHSVRPTLTTHRVEREALGALGVRRLIERVKQPEEPSITLMLEPLLIERNSARLTQLT